MPHSAGMMGKSTWDGRWIYAERSDPFANAEHLREGVERAEAAYWIARCLQRLDRDQEAREILRRVLADPTAGIHGVRAQHDLDFLDVRAQLQQRRITPGERR